MAESSIPASAAPPLILCSGLAADSRVFAPQRLCFPDLIVPEWPVPLANESLDAYCQRLATGLTHHDRPIIGGASFGGIIALYLAQYLKPRALILIGSIHHPSELPPWIRAVRFTRHFVRFVPVRLLQWLFLPFSSRAFARLAPHLAGVAAQFCQANPAVFRWSLRALLEFTKGPSVDCPIYHIHGARDFVLPSRYTKPNTLIARGGHVISLTHSREVNEFIRSVMSQLVDHTTNCR